MHHLDEAVRIFRKEDFAEPAKFMFDRDFSSEKYSRG